MGNIINESVLLRVLQEIKQQLKELFQENDQQYEQQTEYIETLNRISVCGKRLIYKTQHLIDSYRYINQNIELSVAPILLNEVIQQLQENFAIIAQAKGVLLENLMNSDLPLVMASEIHLKQALFSILEYSLRYTNQGKITISSLEEKGFLQLCITDTGADWQEEQLQCIMNTKQLDVNQAEWFSDSMELFLNKKIIEAQGGNFLLSYKLGEGRKIKIQLPIVAEQRTAIKHSRRENKTQAIKKRILVLEDSQIDCKLLLAALGKDFETIIVTNGLDGIERIEAEKFDLIILDINLPILSGLDVLVHCRQKYQQNELPIILVTHENNIETIIRGYRLGANDYFIKPVNPLVLLEKINFHIKNQSSVHNIKYLKSQIALEKEKRKLLQDKLVQFQKSTIAKLNDQNCAIIKVDPKFRIVNFDKNAEIIFGKDSMEVLMKPFDILIHQQEMQLSTAINVKKNYVIMFHCQTAQRQRQVFLAAFIHSFPNGGSFYFHLEQLNDLDVPLTLFSWDLAAFGITKQRTQTEVQANPEHMIQHEPPRTPKKTLSSDQIEEKLKQITVQTMSLALQYWQITTGKDRAELAEESSLWRMSIDTKGTVRVRTMDKYLNIHKLPARPRYRIVLQTASFILQNCPDLAPDVKERLKKSLDQLFELVALTQE